MEFTRVIVLASVLAIVAGLETSNAALEAPKLEHIAPKEIIGDRKEASLLAVAPAPAPAPATTLEAIPKVVLTRDPSGPGLYRTETGELVRLTKNLQEPVLRPIYESPSIMYRRNSPEPVPAVADPAYLRFLEASQRPIFRTGESLRRSPSPPMPIMMRSAAPDTATPSGRYFLDNVLGGYGAGYGNGYGVGYPSYGAGYAGYPSYGAGYAGYGAGYGTGYAGYGAGYGTGYAGYGVYPPVLY